MERGGGGRNFTHERTGEPREELEGEEVQGRKNGWMEKEKEDVLGLKVVPFGS